VLTKVSKRGPFGIGWVDLTGLAFAVRPDLKDLPELGVRGIRIVRAELSESGLTVEVEAG
jgi:hypothetical protein